jgi:putative membrane protein
MLKSLPKSHIIIYIIYLIVWSLAAIDPKYPDDWLLENVLVFAMTPLVIWLDIKFRFTTTSMIFLLIFASCHSLGSHYTYAEMEYFNTITQWFGFERNHYDRVVHFLFGLLLFHPIFELTTRMVSSVKITLFFTVTLIISIATIYEMIEWLAVLLFNPDLGMAFLGTQGDIWDAHKDTLGAIIGAILNLLFYRYYERLMERNKNI